jgi:hypothetical protein
MKLCGCIVPFNQSDNSIGVKKVGDDRTVMFKGGVNRVNKSAGVTGLYSGGSKVGSSGAVTKGSNMSLSFKDRLKTRIF